MAVTMADITKLRKMTGAGMMDCKNALTDAEGDFDKAMKIIREKGQAVAAKRSDREASEGCVLVKVEEGFGAIIALKCETDFVAQNADFVKLTQDILDAAVANKCKTLEEVLALPMGDATVAQAVTDRTGITGEKMELDGYMVLEGATIAAYNHMNRNGLCTMVAFNKKVDEQLAKQVAMQVAAMNPIAVDEDGVSEEVKQKEIEVAVEKTKVEQVQKAVEAALKKANINPAHVDSEDHMESNMAKGWITAEDVAKAKEIIATVSAEKAANMPEQMIQNIAKGRLAKFLKEVCLLNQEDIMDAKKTVREVLKEADPELKVVDFKRFTLRAEYSQGIKNIETAAQKVCSGRIFLWLSVMLRLSVYAESGTRTFAYKVNGSGTCLHFAGPVSSGICFPLSSYCFCFRISFFLQQFYYFLFEVSLNDNLSVFSRSAYSTFRLEEFSQIFQVVLGADKAGN